MRSTTPCLCMGYKGLAGTTRPLHSWQGRRQQGPAKSTMCLMPETGTWRLLSCCMLYVQVRKGFGMDHETITQLAEKEAAGSSGVNFLPYITGERTPNWPHSSGVLTGLRPGSLRPGLLYRAAMEGATFSLLAGLPILLLASVLAATSWPALASLLCRCLSHPAPTCRSACASACFSYGCQKTARPCCTAQQGRAVLPPCLQFCS